MKTKKIFPSEMAYLVGIVVLAFESKFNFKDKLPYRKFFTE